MDSTEITPEHPGNVECIIDGIPRDLIEQIFLKLPVSSLLWCLGVCKQWRKIIRCPQFVAAHLQCAPCCTLLFAPQQSGFNRLHPSDAILFDEALSPSAWAVPVIGPDDILCGSCNGLLCLYTNTSTIKIANLATGACLHLEKPVKNLKGDHFSFYSFGFHPVTKEYKIAHFLRDCRPYSAGRFSAIQVYTLGDEEWELVTTPEYLRFKFEKHSVVVNLGGKMYWLTEDRGSSWHHAVMSFDFSEKSFALIQLPTVDLEDYATDCPRRYWITEIDGKVCVATAQTNGYLPRALIGKLQIWTLNGKLEQRWRQKYNIQLPSHSIRALPFFHKDKIVIHTLNGNLYSYKVPGQNFEIELSKSVKLLHLSHHINNNIRFHIYVRSLVPLNVYRNGAIVRRPNRKEGWNSNKWQAWEHVLCKREEMCNSLHQLVAEVLALCEKINHILQSLPNEEVLQRIEVEVNHMLQHLPICPDQHPKPLRRLNWVGQSWDMEKLTALVDRIKCIVKLQVIHLFSITKMTSRQSKRVIQ
uniref:Uncharacterized protein n=1 Tax=Avena sativa TaxID=4498 RepID=A0ACD5XV80_AVESA